MNELKTFQNEEFGSVRTVMIDGEPWFVGKDITGILGYTNPQKAVRDHVDDEDRGVNEMDTPGGRQALVMVNESGLYSLILSSKLPTAKKFKRWVTSEVLPALRKDGKYQMQPMTTLEILQANVNALVEQERRLKEHDKRLDEYDNRFDIVEKNVKMLQAKTETRPEDMFTVTGYAALVGKHVSLKEARDLGKEASELSREKGYAIEKTRDERYGRVNVYRAEILEEVFANYVPKA